MPFFKRTRHFSKLSIMITSLTITLEDHENILAWMNRMSYLGMVLFVPCQMGFDLVKIRVPQFRICNLRKIVMIILKNAHPWRYYSLLTHGGILLWNAYPAGESWSLRWVEASTTKLLSTRSFSPDHQDTLGLGFPAIKKRPFN